MPNPWHGHLAILYTPRDLPEVVATTPVILVCKLVMLCLSNLITEPFTLQREWMVGVVEKMGLAQPMSPHITAVQDCPSWKLPECPPHLSEVKHFGKYW